MNGLDNYNVLKRTVIEPQVEIRLKETNASKCATVEREKK